MSFGRVDVSLLVAYTDPTAWIFLAVTDTVPLASSFRSLDILILLEYYAIINQGSCEIKACWILSWRNGQYEIEVISSTTSAQLYKP